VSEQQAGDGGQMIESNASTRAAPGVGSGEQLVKLQSVGPPAAGQ